MDFTTFNVCNKRLFNKYDITVSFNTRNNHFIGFDKTRLSSYQLINLYKSVQLNTK